MLIAEADLGIEKILDNLVYVMVLAFFLVELLSNVQSFGFQGYIDVLVGLFEFFRGWDVFGFGLGFSSFEENFSSADIKDVEGCSYHI